jgi:hypothetical protein
MGEKVKHRASEMVESGKEKVAERIDRTGERLERRAERLETQGGIRKQAGKVVHRAGDALESGAGYLRTHDIGTIGDDLTRQIRSHPYLSVGAALGTGFMLGRIFGGGGEEEQEEERMRSELEECEQCMRQGRQRTSAFNRMKGQMGNAVMGGLSAMVARRVRDSIAGR